MPYCFNRPDGVAFVLLADLPGTPWGIFEAEADEPWTPESPVREDLAALIESGKRYPPALALAREEVCGVFGDHEPSQAEFAVAYGNALQAHLSRQPESSYVLAPALKDESGSLVKGEWYWVLRIAGSPPKASWVSDDFQILDIDMNHFDLTGQQVKRLGYTG